MFDAGELKSLDATGAYVGHKHRFKTSRQWDVETNLAYGYGFLDTPAFVASGANHILHQGWANLLVFPNDNLAVGVQYQYGNRETRADGSGEDNRFMFVVAITTKKGTTASNVFSDSTGFAREFSNEELEIYEGTAGTANRQSL